MKSTISVLFWLLILTAAQTVKAQPQLLSEMSISAPFFQSGEYENLSEHLQDAISYPIMSKKDGRQGTEVVCFTVSRFGTIEDIRVINSVSKEVDREVISALRETCGKWNPGTINGQITSMSKEIALPFVLVSYEDMVRTADACMKKANRLMYSENKPEKALKYYNMAYRLLPNESSVVSGRELCLQELGMEMGMDHLTMIMTD